MHNIRSKFISFTTICSVILVASCADGGYREMGGAVLGGAAGGAAGAQVGQGTGRTAAIIAGTVLGALIGSSVGRSMDDTDRLKTARALEGTPSGQSTGWINPDTGTQYQFTPMRTFQGSNRQPCREFSSTAIIDGQRETVYGTACRQSDGSWQTSSR